MKLCLECNETNHYVLSFNKLFSQRLIEMILLKPFVVKLIFYLKTIYSNSIKRFSTVDPGKNAYLLRSRMKPVK